MGQLEQIGDMLTEKREREERSKLAVAMLELIRVSRAQGHPPANVLLLLESALQNFTIDEPDELG